MAKKLLAKYLHEFEGHNGCPEPGDGIRAIKKWWKLTACSEFADIDIPIDELRNASLELAEASADLIDRNIAALTAELLEPFESAVAVGSVARCEATQTSDIDLNVQISDEWASALEDDIGKPSFSSYCELVTDREKVFMNHFGATFDELVSLGLPVDRAIPYSQSEIDEWPKHDDRLFILSNLLLAAAEVGGSTSFVKPNNSQKDIDLRSKLAASRACLLGKKFGMLKDAGDRASLVKALHSVTSTFSQVVVALLGDSSRWNWPYWKVFDSIVLKKAIDPVTRQTALNLAATVCLHRTNRASTNLVKTDLVHRVKNALDALHLAMLGIQSEPPNPMINHQEREIILTVLEDTHSWKKEGERYCVVDN